MPRGKKRDITGERFGRLVALQHAEFKNGASYWQCQCDCGKTHVVALRHLTGGTTQSCGCLRRELSSPDLAGRRFGRLVVAARKPELKDKHGRSFWLCHCDCGGTKVVRTDLLTQGRTSSCGCKRIGRQRVPAQRVDAQDDSWEKEADGLVWVTVDGLRCTLKEWSRRTGLKPFTIGRRLRRGWTPKAAVFGARIFGAPNRNALTTLTQEQLALLDGLLAGDGHYESHTPRSRFYKRTARFMLGTPFLEYAQAVQQALLAVGIQAKLPPPTPRASGAGGHYVDYHVSTLAEPAFGEQWERWYDGKPDHKGYIRKHFPQDFADAPTSWNWMYVGDGNLTRKDYSHVLSLCTHFLKPESEFMIELLATKGMRATLSPRKPPHPNGRYTVRLYTEATVPFLNYIGPPPCEFFEYKWDFRVRPFRPCEGCGRLFQLTAKNKKHCSAKCYNLHYSRRRRETNPEHLRAIRQRAATKKRLEKWGTLHGRCAFCGRRFKWGKRVTKFCGRKCCRTAVDRKLQGTQITPWHEVSDAR